MSIMNTFSMLIPSNDGGRKLIIPVFAGFLIKDEIFADNRQEYERILNTVNPHSKEYRDRLWDLEILNKFPPGMPHDRAAAHKIDAYEIQDPQWIEIETKSLKHFREPPKRKLETFVCITQKQLIPQGRGKKLFSADLGEVLKNERFEGNEFIDIKFEQHRTMSHYTFSMKAGNMNSERPLEFHIRQYVAINGVEIDKEPQRTIVASPMFSMDYSKPNRAGIMFGFEYSKRKVRHLVE